MWSCPAFADFNNDHLLESVFCDEDGTIHCLDSQGNELWTFTYGSHLYSSPVITDLDQDDNQDIIVGTYMNDTICLTGNGQVKWDSQMDWFVFASPALADINNDGNTEVIIGSLDKHLYCLDTSGGKLWSYKTIDKIYGSAAIADLEGDGLVEIVFGSYTQILYCLGLNYTSSSANQWNTFRGGNFHTGWMDSDGDHVDDLTEVTYYESDPYTWEGEHLPKVRPTNLFPNISLVLLLSSLFIIVCVTSFKKKISKN